MVLQVNGSDRNFENYFISVLSRFKKAHNF